LGSEGWLDTGNRLGRRGHPRTSADTVIDIAKGEIAMPPRSEAQRRAMQAAAHGKSTIGIPKSVGKEFVAADKGGKLPQHKQQQPHRPQKR
jgi:hypothetical protein